MIVFVRVPTQWSASQLKSGFDDRVLFTVLDNFTAVSPQLAVARVKFHGVALSVFSAHEPHEFRTLS